MTTNLHAQLAADPVFVEALGDRISAGIANELIEVLSEAAVEIFNADGITNPVYVRVRAMQSRIREATKVEQEESRS